MPQLGDRQIQRPCTGVEFLSDVGALNDLAGGSDIADIFNSRRQAIEPIARKLHNLESTGELTRALTTLCASYVHMTCNRLSGAESPPEGQVLGLLRRARHTIEKVQTPSPMRSEAIK